MSNLKLRYGKSIDRILPLVYQVIFLLFLLLLNLQFCHAQGNLFTVLKSSKKIEIKIDGISGNVNFSYRLLIQGEDIQQVSGNSYIVPEKSYLSLQLYNYQTSTDIPEDIEKKLNVIVGSNGFVKAPLQLSITQPSPPVVKHEIKNKITGVKLPISVIYDRGISLALDELYLDFKVDIESSKSNNNSQITNQDNSIVAQPKPNPPNINNISSTDTPVDPISKVEVTPEEQEEINSYQKWLKSKDVDEGRQFLDEYPNSQYRNRVLRELPISYQKPQRNGNHYEIELNYLREIDTLNWDEGIIMTTTPVKKPPFGYLLSIEVKPGKGQHLGFFDKTKKPIFQNIEIDLENILEGDAKLSENKDSLILSFTGGRPPYTVFFLQGGSVQAELKEIRDSFLVIDVINFLGANDLKNGSYSLELWDETKIVTDNFKDKSFNLIGQDKPSNPLPIFIYYLIGGLAFLFGMLILRNSNRKRKRAKLKKIQQEKSSPNVTPTTKVEAEKTLTTEFKKNENTPQEKPKVEKINEASASIKVSSNSQIRVTKRVSTQQELPFRPQFEPHYFQALNLDQHWSNSMVERVFFAKSAILELDHFLRQENTNKLLHKVGKDDQGIPLWESTDDIPEIGGMLLGQKNNLNDQGFDISIEKFIPIAASFQNVYKLEMDTLSLARELSNAQDDFPTYRLVGWFHTHPGHGLFLSQPDLKIQRGHFRHPYQVAMEIDSLTENLDTAFFSYQKNGHMNNQHTRKQGVPWFAWTDIEKFTRKK